MDPTESPRVAVCVCTHRRPEILATLLDHLAQRAEEVEGRVGVVVVDDDPAASAREVCENASRGELTIRYLHVGGQNISEARNAAIDGGIASGAAFLAFIDDDCLPHPGWIRELLAVQERWSADVVTGSCADEAPRGAPAWVADQGVLDAPVALADGAAVEHGFLKNTLISTSVLAERGIRFSPDFGKIGGEDAMFFYALADLGVEHRHAANALVTEPVPAERLRLGYVLRRRVWYGNSETTTCVAAGRSTRSRMGARGLVLLAVAAVSPIRRMFSRRPPHVRHSLCLAAQGAGRVMGAAGIRITHR